MRTSAVTALANALQAAGIPIVSVSPSGTAFAVQYAASATAAQISQGNALASGWSQKDRIPVLLIDLFNSLNALNATQKANINAYLFGATRPQVWENDAGPNAAAMGAVVLNAGSIASLTAAQKVGLAAMYCQDNPRVFVANAAVDATINVPGDQTTG